MRSLFLITSAINATSEFGVFDQKERLEQTLQTIESIRSKAPNSFLIILEMAINPLSQEQKFILSKFVEEVIEFHNDQGVIEIFKKYSGGGWG